MVVIVYQVGGYGGINAVEVLLFDANTIIIIGKLRPRKHCIRAVFYSLL